MKCSNRVHCSIQRRSVAEPSQSNDWSNGTSVILVSAPNKECASVSKFIIMQHCISPVFHVIMERQGGHFNFGKRGKEHFTQDNSAPVRMDKHWHDMRL